MSAEKGDHSLDSMPPPSSGQDPWQQEPSSPFSSDSRQTPGSSQDSPKALPDQGLDNGYTDLEASTSRSSPHFRSDTNKDGLDSYTANEERTVRRKLDFRLVGFVALLYMFSFLDRSNVGNAQLAGLSTDLGMSDSQYTLILRSFYVTYILFEWMTLLYRVVRAHIYIPLCVLSWGTIASLQALTTGFKGMLFCRLALGIAEAAFVGIPYYLSFFFRRDELAYRVGIFISAAPLASCFASSLAYAITRWGSKTSIQPWRLLFLVEGFPSILISFWAWRILPDSPGETKWLNTRERRVAELRMMDPGTDVKFHPAEKKHLNWADILSTLKDPKAYLTAGMFFSCNMAFSSMPVFEPSIIKSMGYSAVTAQGLSALPHLSAFFAVLIFSHLSDKYRTRALVIVPVALLSQLGYILLALAPTLHFSSALKYLCLFPITAGFFTSVTLVIVWTLDNQVTASSKGAGMTLIQIFGQMGSIIGTGIYSERQGPDYILGHSICAVFMALVALLAAALRRLLAAQNQKLQDDGYEMVTTAADEDEDDYSRPKEKAAKFRYIL